VHEKRAENLGQADPSDAAAARELRSILDEGVKPLEKAVPKRIVTFK
jgi:hypothetical protein